MIRMFLIFLAMTTGIAGLILLFRQMTGKEKLETLKVVAFSAGCSIIALLILFFIVIAF